MLQRAASNAYSWWWASHIRTKQSKWLEESLQDMEEKVFHMVKLIQEDGDSFAKRAEMYYKRRPELINFVEESYRAFRSLAERYDKLSKDLQSANHTLATLCPEQFQMEMDEDDEYGSPKSRRNCRPVQRPGTNIPKAPAKKLKVVITTAAVSNKLQPKKPEPPEVVKKTTPKSGLTMNQATDEIDKLQKEILKLQTSKEFVKNSYQSGQARYKGMENQITEMQQRVDRLQDEFGVTKAIEDEEARTLMAETALKSCRETLAELLEKQVRAARDAREEYKKLEDARKRMNAIKIPDIFNQKKEANENSSDLVYKSDSSRKAVSEAIESLQEKIKEQLDGNSIESLTVTQLVEKIDGLVNKVVDMETSVSTQTILIDRLRGEAIDFQKKIKSFEEDNKATTVPNENLTTQVEDIEKRWNDIKNINQDLENHNTTLRNSIAEARCNLDQLSDKLNTVKSDEEDEEEEGTDSPQSEAESLSELDPKENIEKKAEDPLASGDRSLTSTSSASSVTGGEQEVKTEAEKQDPDADATVAKKEEEAAKKNSSPVTVDKAASEKIEETVDKAEESKKIEETVDEAEESKKIEETEMERETSTSPQSGDSDSEKEAEIILDKEDEADWREAFLNGMGDKDRAMLKEYKTVLRTYKELKKKMAEMEKKGRDSEFEFTLQITDLKTVIAKRDEDIHKLRQKVFALSAASGNCAGNKGSKEVKPSAVPVQTLKAAESRTQSSRIQSSEDDDDDDDDFKIPTLNKPVLSPVEEKLRMEIDAILDENLEFWLRFSSSFHQVQKFKTTVQDLQHELSKVKQKKTTQENSVETQDLRTEVRPIFKHLREIHTELTVWLEQSVKLKDEVKRRSSSLCHIQEEITKALKEGVEGEEIQFSSHQAAKFQGEVLNMKQENNKVNEELQAGVDHVTILQLDVEKTLKRLGQEFGLGGNKPQLSHSTSKSKIPLGSFIFGNKPKKQKKSVFSSFNPNKKYQGLKELL
ncbi:PREDICTED: kinase-interacting protein 1 [Ipomoea nil]|uniref:kinase-interacting protein 1 n=1 Tax=Ipomoea nil TaxID=35883 RepID=UPI000900A332|nr:PREDICTED: kinase-interacting protein 1 [Ipomoea nil]